MNEQEEKPVEIVGESFEQQLTEQILPDTSKESAMSKSMQKRLAIQMAGAQFHHGTPAHNPTKKGGKGITKGTKKIFPKAEKAAKVMRKLNKKSHVRKFTGKNHKAK